MPRYFFDIIDDGELNIDHVGSECVDDAAAMQEARRCAVEMASERLDSQALALRIAVSGSNFANIASVSLQTANGMLLTPVTQARGDAAGPAIAVAVLPKVTTKPE